MNKVWIALTVILIILIAGFAIVVSSKKTPTAKIGNQTLNLYIAKSDKDKQVGLSKYKKIENNRGMIFQFGRADYYPFWMKDMKFPIDIIFIKDEEIVTIFKNVNPVSDNKNLRVYNSDKPADTVIEVNAGLSEKYKLKVGDKISLSNI